MKLSEAYQHIKQNIVVDIQSGCWVWQLKRHVHGYGRMHIGNRTTQAHRVMYQLTKGVTLRSDQFVCHKCDNPPCCNPDHMFVGSALDNNMDFLHKGGDRGVPKETVAAIDKDLKNGLTYRAIAARYSVARGTVWKIKFRHLYHARQLDAVGSP